MARDAEVIDAVLRGDIERYAELVQRYQAAAWALAYRFLGNWEDAKDASQNGFVKAYQSLGRFRGDAKFSTWLYRIIVNECQDAYKRNARVRADSLDASDDAGELLFDVPDSSGDVLRQRELARSLQRALSRLASHQRTAFILHHLHGLSIGEAASVMGCREGTVKTHLFRACARLREELAGLWKSEAGA